MKKLILLIINLLTYNTIVIAANITESQAVESVKNLIGEISTMYDYYIVEDNDPTYWTVFVDAEPLKLWEHDSFTYRVPRTVNSLNNVNVLNKVDMRMPPLERLKPIFVTNKKFASLNNVLIQCAR